MHFLLLMLPHSKSHQCLWRDTTLVFWGSQRSVQSMCWAPCYLIENISSLESRNIFLYTPNPPCKLKLGTERRMPFEIFYNVLVIYFSPAWHILVTCNMNLSRTQTNNIDLNICIFTSFFFFLWQRMSFICRINIIIKINVYKQEN